MSGHSKWSQIHRQKGVADAKRGAIFTKLGKNLSIAAKLGGGDPVTNFRLRLAIDQAKAANMPKDNIDRAIKRGTGEIAGGIIETITYEGFGPEGSAFIIECLTDNRNRTAANIKHHLTKYGGSLGAPGSVSWQFEQKGIIRVKAVPDELELAVIDAGADDIRQEDGGTTIYTNPTALRTVKELFEGNHIEVEYAETAQVPKEKKIVSAEAQGTIEKLCTDLENDEDVNNYYTNAEG